MYEEEELFRPLFIENLRRFKDQQIIKILCGVRRSGKSTILKTYKKELIALGVPTQNIVERLYSSMEFEEDFDAVISTNLKGVFNCIKHISRQMLKQKAGRIINISSVWGNAGASMEVAYSASKGGVNAFTKALAKELAPSNIQVNAISCGGIDTAMNACFSPEDMDALRAEIPADRIGRPEEVAALVLQTAKAPEYMTGQIITIDGGWC